MAGVPDSQHLDLDRLRKLRRDWLEWCDTPGSGRARSYTITVDEMELLMALPARLAQAEDLLRQVEWAGPQSYGVPVCPSCRKKYPDHNSGCALAALLDSQGEK